MELFPCSDFVNANSALPSLQGLALPNNPNPIGTMTLTGLPLGASYLARQGLALPDSGEVPLLDPAHPRYPGHPGRLVQVGRCLCV